MIEKNEDLLKEVFGPNLSPPERFYFPGTSTHDLGEKFGNLVKNEGDVLVLVDGSFDVPHPAHDWYLRHCKLIGAGIALSKKELEATPLNLQMELLSGAVSLAVTVDADYKVSAKKGNDVSKGGSERPIYPWKARADRLANLSFNIGSAVINTVDLVTVEGDPAHHNTPLEDSLKLASFLQKCGLLSGLIVYGEHAKTATKASELGINTRIIPDSIAYEINPLTDTRYSSSDIIRRAKGKKPLDRKSTHSNIPSLFDADA